MSRTFDFYRSTNSRLHVALDQEDNYERYLRRIEKIVDKKPSQDMSSSFYMGFLNKIKQVSRSHHSSEKSMSITSENQHLLNKILDVKNRKN